MNRCSFCEWIPILPWPVWPLAGQCLLGQNVVVGSMMVLLALCGSRPRGVYLDPHFRYKCASPRLSAELPPSHLTDKILANRGRLEGERKQVTVLFNDVTGYTALSEQLGEEALFALMDDLYELFIHEIHRYEGTVNELTGDGIVAFFGAPLAVEQAPQRAVRAALALQEAVAPYSARDP